ncbi:MAG: NRDE family protein [Alphaproteobacteria bacterium]|nr:NRDE family protein [Alphaproteobacteria bacterium]
MCTVVILRNSGEAWPLLLAANRDEMSDRPWEPPGRHWPDRGDVVAGYDRMGGGSWLGINDVGVVAAVLNRSGSLGPAPDRRSRGELVLEALDHAEAEVAARALCDLSPTSYRSFNLVVADAQDAFWLRHTGEGKEPITMAEIPPGLSMITDFDRNDSACPRIRDYLPLFAAAPEPDPDNDDWVAWETLLAGRSLDPENDAQAAMTLHSEGGLATLSSSIIALPAPRIPPPKPLWRFAFGPPDTTPFITLDMSADMETEGQEKL